MEALRRIRDDERTAWLPVVILSAFGATARVHEAFGLGANASIDKASCSVPFPELVREMARFWLAVNEPPLIIWRA